MTVLSHSQGSFKFTKHVVIGTDAPTRYAEKRVLDIFHRDPPSRVLV